MTINFNKRRIEMTENEYNKAKQYNSDAYKDLVSARREFPTFSITTIKSKKKHGDGLKGLTFEFMQSYIAKYGTEQQLENYQKLRGADDALGVLSPTYGEVKKWFLKQFPAILEYREIVDKILNDEVA